jgi:hypothetical protein
MIKELRALGRKAGVTAVSIENDNIPAIIATYKRGGRVYT